jgi:hypothetical protein
LKIRRDILLFAAVAVAAIAVGWWLLAKRPGVAIETFVRDHKQQAEAVRPHVPAADAFKATVCPGEACVAVEVGGLTFIYNAAAGAAEGVIALGLMHPNVDGVLLPDARLQSVEGLAYLAQASGGAGRTDALKVFAPSGSLTVVDGANLLASDERGPRLTLSPDGADQGLAGKLLFDSGVVEIRAFGVRGRVYRIEFEDKSLILAGCAAEEEDILAATRGTKVAAGILTAGSAQLLPGETPRCTDIAELLEGARQARLAATLIIPAAPASTVPGALAAWGEVIAGGRLPYVMLGKGYTWIDLSGPAPRTSDGR